MVKKSYLFVAVQFTAIVILALTGPVFPEDKILLSIEILFAVFGLWAMYKFRFRFNAVPDLKKNSPLITDGPYRIVRHPMYAAAIFITLIWLINKFTLARLAVWIILIADLHFKSEYEERLLENKFPEYKLIREKIKKILPFIY